MRANFVCPELEDGFTELEWPELPETEARKRITEIREGGTDWRARNPGQKGQQPKSRLENRDVTAIGKGAQKGAREEIKDPGQSPSVFGRAMGGPAPAPDDRSRTPPPAARTQRQRLQRRSWRQRRGWRCEQERHGAGAEAEVAAAARQVGLPAVRRAPAPPRRPRRGTERAFLPPGGRAGQGVAGARARHRALYSCASPMAGGQQGRPLVWSGRSGDGSADTPMAFTITSPLPGFMLAHGTAQVQCLFVQVAIRWA
ncbi:unnamed protein product [Prorocentrum cordatum]|uniref:Uncharacterized protein n=1 Tax=Prorocentrum cordatum TaxID=2364126 RepID=A0ABN9W1T1_9DINO|nr:unnamed protein product [Polarella glacialis]